MPGTHFIYSLVIKLELGSYRNFRKILYAQYLQIEGLFHFVEKRRNVVLKLPSRKLMNASLNTPGTAGGPLAQAAVTEQ